MNRREFLKGTLATTAGVACFAHAASTEGSASRDGSGSGWIIDTNVELFGWPHRELKYGATQALVEKLQTHSVRQAWAGSYEALFHKNIDGVNRRLAEECQRNGRGMLAPLGTVNPVWPDWEEDLRRCDEDYGMHGIKLYPSYQNYTLDHPNFEKLLRQATDRGMLVQVAVAMEDERVHHPRTVLSAVDTQPLRDTLNRVPDARVMLVNPFRHVRGNELRALVRETNVLFEISNLDGTGGLERILSGSHWYLPVTMPLERLVFGSHAPLFPLENALFKFMESELSKVQCEAIWKENAGRFLATASMKSDNRRQNRSQP